MSSASGEQPRAKPTKAGASSSSSGGPDSDKFANAVKQATALPLTEQMDLLSQALLREYMHRKGYKRTLAAFDKENPRGEKTISSRAVMNDLMALQVIQQRNKVDRKENALATIMELLCSYRLRKRDIRLHHGNSTSSGGGEAQERKPYDSSDDEKDMLGKVEERKKEEEMILEKQKELAKAKKKEKKEKKEKKDKKDKKDNKKKNTEGGDAAAAEGTAKLLTASEGGAGKKPKVFDPLQLSKQNSLSSDERSLLASGTSSSEHRGGRSWLPTSAVAAIGLSSGPYSPDKQEASTSDPSENYKAPVFLAGDGMQLMANRARLDINRAMSIDSPGVSPDHFRKQYNPNAQQPKGAMAKSDEPPPKPVVETTKPDAGTEKPKKTRKTVKILVADDP